MRQKIVADRQIDWHTKVNQYTPTPPLERGSTIKCEGNLWQWPSNFGINTFFFGVNWLIRYWRDKTRLHELTLAYRPKNKLDLTGKKSIHLLKTEFRMTNVLEIHDVTCIYFMYFQKNYTFYLLPKNYTFTSKKTILKTMKYL